MLKLNRYYVIKDTDGTSFEQGDIVYVYERIELSGLPVWYARKYKSKIVQLIEEYNVFCLSDEMTKKLSANS